MKWISAKWWTLHSNLTKRRAIDPSTSQDKLSHRGESVVVHVRRATADRFEMPIHLTTFFAHGSYRYDTTSLHLSGG